MYGGIETSDLAGGLRESPEEFAEHFGMRADVEGFRDGTATAVPAKEPCARAGHRYGEELDPVLACKDLGDMADVLTPSPIPATIERRIIGAGEEVVFLPVDAVRTVHEEVVRGIWFDFDEQLRIAERDARGRVFSSG